MIDMLHTNLVKQLVRLMKGKNIPEIVEEFQREGEQQHNAMNDDSSDDDDDDYHVPHNWSGYDFSK